MAALGNHGGFFHFWGLAHGNGDLSPLPERGACIRVAKEAGRKPVLAKASSQVRVLPLPQSTRMGPQALTVKRSALNRRKEVRVLRGQRSIFDNRIVDDARGRAPPRPRRCSRSRSGDGACLKRRRCWFDSRREHQASEEA